MLERVAQNDYKVQMPDKDRVLHANMLKFYYPGQKPDGSKKAATMLVRDTEDEEDLIQLPGTKVGQEQRWDRQKKMLL